MILCALLDGPASGNAASGHVRLPLGLSFDLAAPGRDAG